MDHSDLNPEQRRAVVTEASPLCILAGAGSGKTRVLTRRIAHRVATGAAESDRVLALTFTRKAAGELNARLRALGVPGRPTAGTFHAVAYAQLRRRWADRDEREPALLDRKGMILGRLMRGSKAQPGDVASEIEWAKARMVNPSAYVIEATKAGRDAPLPLDEIADLYRRYEAEKRKGGLVDFDDLLIGLAKAIDDDVSFAAAQRWRFRHVFVDEFQDVNPVQHNLLMAWVGDRTDLCVVGDPNQAIYGWNGADPTFLTGFGRRFPTAEVVRLNENYRSSPQILAAANAVLADGWSRTPPLRPNRPAGPAPSMQSYPDEAGEAEGVAAAIRRAHDENDEPWSDFAVLVRTNAQTVALERALRANDIPVRVRSDGSFLRQPEIRQALQSLQSARGPFDAAVASLEQGLDSVTPEDRRANVETLITLAREFLELDPSGDGAAFAGWLLTALRQDASLDAGDAVEVVTFHRAKGLEWPTVFVCGLERGLVPVGRAESTDERAEERRLLYVALTRAERVLHCSWAQTRTFGSRTSNRQASPWVAVIDAACGRATISRAAAAKPRTRPTKLPGGDPDPPLLAELKAWRLDRSRAAKLPAYVLFPDKTLEAIAATKPDSEPALLDVPGVGPMKLATWGSDVLAIVAKHREEPE
jgi:DNA helicase-2/ATP-dependent DNA helicase PcrA